MASQGLLALGATAGASTAGSVIAGAAVLQLEYLGLLISLIQLSLEFQRLMIYVGWEHILTECEVPV